MGKFDVTMKIADEGGGASRSEMDQLWTYYYTTANKFLVGGTESLPTVRIRIRRGTAHSLTEIILLL